MHNTIKKERNHKEQKKKKTDFGKKIHISQGPTVSINVSKTFLKKSSMNGI